MNQATEKDQIAKDMMMNLLDRNLADVADLPEYLDKAPTGYYKLKVEDIVYKNVEIQEKGKTGKTDAPTVQVEYSIQGILELEDQTIPEEKHPKLGSRFAETFFMHNDPQKAIEVIKAKYKAIAEELKIEKVSDLLEQMKGLDIGATVKSKADKNKEDRWYIQASNCVLFKG